jgi:hypothetical protein
VPVVRFPGDKNGLLSDPALDPNVRLKLVLEHLKRLRTEWEDACQACDALEESEVSRTDIHRARNEVRAAYARWDEVSAQADALARDLRRAAPDANRYEQLYRLTLAELKEQFDGGPQYDLLCERAAALTARLRRMEDSAREFPAADHARLNQQLLSYINQLQKYTEAMKSETLSREAQGVAEQILMIVEKSLATTYPELWHSVMRDVRQALESAA